MIGWLSPLLLLLSPATVAAPAPASPVVPQGRFVAWPPDGTIDRVTVAGLTLADTSRACTAFAADAARLGRLDQAWPIVRANENQLGSEATWALSRCPIAYVQRHCPPGGEIRHPNYDAALQAFLAVTGYTHPRDYRPARTARLH
jgi:hypothetical protein